MEGWNEKHNCCWENAERFFIYIFLHQQWKQCLEFALSKLREICKYLAGTCNSNSHVSGLHYLTFCLQKQGREINAMRWVLSENASKELSVIIRLECKEVSLHIEFTTLPTKKPQPLCEKLERKGNWRKRNCGHRLIMHSITRREKMGGGGGVKWEDSVGGAGGSFTPTYMRRMK